MAVDQHMQQRKPQGDAQPDVREVVKTVVSRVTKIAASELDGEKLIRDDLGVDSMQAIETLAILEKELGIIVDPEKAFNVATMNDLFELIEESRMASAWA